MRGNAFTDSHRTAEEAGYPALLLVTMVAAAMMVGAIVLLAAMESAWAFAVSMLTLVAALGLLAGDLVIAFAESNEDADEDADIRGRAA
jgi:membrane protein implicated in regulation of membrane protease activity